MSAQAQLPFPRRAMAHKNANFKYMDTLKRERDRFVALAFCAADALVEKLLDRPEIDPEMRAEIAKNVRKRLSPEDADAAEDGRETAGERAERLFRSGALDETEIHGAIDRGERSLIIEAI